MVTNRIDAEIIRSKIEKAVHRATGRGAVKAAERLKSITKQKLNRSAPDGVHAPRGQPPYKHSGDLQTGIEVSHRENGFVITLDIHSGMMYGKYLENPAKLNRPFAKPSTEELKKELPAILKKVLEKELRKMFTA